MIFEKPDDFGPGITSIVRWKYRIAEAWWKGWMCASAPDCSRGVDLINLRMLCDDSIKIIQRMLDKGSWKKEDMKW